MLQVKDVMKVYTGKAGACMCGCAGKYRVASQHRAAADTARGYAYGDEDVSDRAVAMAVRRLNANPKTVIEDGIAWVDEGARTVVAYLAPSVG